MAAILTPCEKICIVDPASGLCRGCGRSLAEIERWTVLQRRRARARHERAAAAGSTPCGRAGRRRQAARDDRRAPPPALGPADRSRARADRHAGDQRPGQARRPRQPRLSARSPIIWRWWCSSAARCWCCSASGCRRRSRPRCSGSLVGFVLVFAYTYRVELRAVGERVLAELMPGRAAQRAARTVEIVRGRAGDFQVAAKVNGTRVAMVLDTGASAVVLTQEAAKTAGLPLEVLTYTVSVDTANGRARAAAGHARPPRGRRHRRARGAGADRAARPAQDQPARHELPQPAGKLGGARRQADDARAAVTTVRSG